MKKIITLFSAAAIALSASAEFTSAGDGTTYTFAKLASIEGTGVRLDGTAYVCDSSFTISAGDILKLDNNAVVKLDEKVLINIDGTADFCPADTATITATEAGQATAKGFRLYDDNATIAMKHVRMEYVGITMGLTNGSFKAENCTFTLHNTKSASGAVINFTKSNAGNEIKNCLFADNQSAGVTSGANTPVGIVVANCKFSKNVTQNRNRPQINLTASGDNDVVIENNDVEGGHYTLSGGIAVTNMLSMAVNNKVVIRGNKVYENRYGINVTGSLNAEIIDNEIINNCYETNALNGGSAISIYDAAGNGKCKIRGNYMEGNLWGITVINKPTVDAGTADDPGKNHFVNNGNGDPMVRYEFYNNGPNDIQAVGNYWYTDTPADVIFDKADNDATGEVIYLPVGTPQSGVNDVNANKTLKAVEYVNANGQVSAAPFSGLNIVVTTYTDGTRTATKVMK